MPKKLTKRCLPSLVNKEMQHKIPMAYHLTSTSLGKISKISIEVSTSKEKERQTYVLSLEG